MVTPVEAFIDTDPTKISWNRADKTDLVRNRHWSFRAESVRPTVYRPFCRTFGILDPRLADMVYQLPRMFPTPDHENFGMYVVGVGSDKPWAALMVGGIPDLAFWGSSNGQFFPRFTYAPAGEEQGRLFASGDDEQHGGLMRMDNVTNGTLADYRESFGSQVTKDDIFFFVYGLLHSPDYRERYASDLKKMLPRIPTPATRYAFYAFSAAGRLLADLHLGYEEVPAYPVDEEWLRPPSSDPADQAAAFRVTKMAFAKAGREADRSRIVVNSRLTLAGVPEDAYRYMLGSRSAIEWIIDRYQDPHRQAIGHHE